MVVTTLLWPRDLVGSVAGVNCHNRHMGNTALVTKQKQFHGNFFPIFAKNLVSLAKFERKPDKSLFW